MLIPLILYLMAGLCSLVVMLISNEALSGIYRMLLELSWTLPLEPVAQITGIDSPIFSMLFLTVGIAFNGVLLYLLGRCMR